MNGFLLIDKPVGPTSFDIVARVRRAAHEKSVGHGGTLDPDASGLLVCALGSCTRLINYLPLEPKTYRFLIRFGAETNTADAVGDITATTEVIPHPAVLEAVLPDFTGHIKQRPPAFSAIFIDGKRAYARARAGETFSMPEREVTVSALSLLSFDAERKEAALEATVSAGTYIRSLAVDIAKALGSLGHAAEIRRLSTGIFSLDDAIDLCTLAESGAERVISADTIFSRLPNISVTAETAARIARGMDFEAESDSELLFIFSETRELIAVSRLKARGLYHPERVFNADC